MTMTVKGDYDEDFYAWTQDQAQLLREIRPNSIDWEHLAEEVEDLGRSEKRELVSRLVVLMTHLLKWRCQPNHRSRSWSLTIKQQRKKLVHFFKDNKSLAVHVTEFVPEAYEYAVIEAAKETGLDESVFPESCPWSFDEMMDADFLPEVVE